MVSFVRRALVASNAVSRMDNDVIVSLSVVSNASNETKVRRINHPHFSFAQKHQHLHFNQNWRPLSLLIRFGKATANALTKFKGPYKDYEI